jgi:hypothetical protein
MSFLVGDKDQLTILGEVLAFIDSPEFDETTSTFSDDVVTSQMDSLSSEDNASQRTKAIPAKKRKRRNLSSSTRLQQAKKAELLFLRKRVLELDDQLQRLQRPKKRQRPLFPQHQIALEAKAPWTDFHARLQAEETNRHLKALLAAQVQASEALRVFLQSQAICQVRSSIAGKPDKASPRSSWTAPSWSG